MVRVISTDLRAEQRASTRARIIDAVHLVLADESPTTLSMPRVAARAGTSLRTVYRYFPTKEALVDAASHTFEATELGLPEPPTLPTLADYLTATWKGFTASIGSVRAQHLTPAGRDLREARIPRSRALTRTALAGEGLPLADADLDRLADLVVAITSSSMYLELVDRLGHRERDAAELAAFATAAVVEKARRELEVAP
jgi:AcrR family transcriptional regulator